MRRIAWLFGVVLIVLAAGLAGCRSSSAVVEERLPPTAVSISNESGEILTTQEGPIWVLLSGVDEHGLIAEHELTLLTEPGPTAPAGPLVHTGVPASVLEIQHGGPQNLQRFYHVETVDGVTGWISDYYVRQVAYLYDGTSDGVPLYASPDGQVVTRLPNVSPVALKEPTDAAWWLVQSIENETLGWVMATYVRESPSPEFLQNQAHSHE